MLLALTLIVILAAIAAPRWGAAAGRYRADALARRVAGDLDRVRLEAIATGAARGVVFNVGLNRYVAGDVRALDRSGPDLVFSVSSEPYNGRLESADFGGSSTLVFSGFGRPVAPGGVVLVVGGERRAVEVMPETGAVRVYRVRAAEGQPGVAVRTLLYSLDSSVTSGASVAGVEEPN